MENEFVKIGSYQYSSEAIIIKGKLESEGVDVFMADNFTIDTDPLVSNAIGGVKLYVKTDQLEQTRNILEDISRYSVDDKGHAIVCAKCGSTEVDLGTTVKDKVSFFAFLFSFSLFAALPFYTKYKYRCNNCGNEFETQ